MEHVIGYAGWGLNDPNFFGRFLRDNYVDGAIAANYVSSNGRTFHEPPKSWSPGSFISFGHYQHETWRPGEGRLSVGKGTTHIKIFSRRRKGEENIV
jgi:hypothetical protein